MRIFPEFLSSSHREREREREKSGIPPSELFFPGEVEGFFFLFA